MTRVEAILSKVRANLSDLDKERWTDEQLITYIDSAQKELIALTGSLKDVIHINLVNGEQVYTLPDNVVNVLAVFYNSKKLPFKAMDEKFLTDDKGLPQYVLINMVNDGKIILYPIPDGIDEENDYLKVFVTKMPKTITSVNDILDINGMYDLAIEYYVTYRALIGNQDTVSLQLAAEFKSKYLQYLDLLNKNSSISYKQFVRVSEYKGFL